MAAALKPIYTAATAEQAEQELAEFEAQWGSRYPMIGRSWRNNWARVIPFFQFPEEIRRVIYTTNAVESLNYSLRKIIKNRSLFPNDEAVFKLLRDRVRRQNAVTLNHQQAIYTEKLRPSYRLDFAHSDSGHFVTLRFSLSDPPPHSRLQIHNIFRLLRRRWVLG